MLWQSKGCLKPLGLICVAKKVAAALGLTIIADDKDAGFCVLSVSELELVIKSKLAENLYKEVPSIDLDAQGLLPGDRRLTRRGALLEEEPQLSAQLIRSCYDATACADLVLTCKAHKP